MNIKQIRRTLLNDQVGDFSWYLFGTIIPILLNFIKNPIFTRYFSPQEYGYYSLVFLTFNYCSLTLYSWLSSNIWRYYYQYKNDNLLNVFFSNIGGLYLIGSIILAIITLFWYFHVESLMVKKIILFSFLYYLLNDITSLYLVMIRLEKKSKAYNLIQSLRAIINFALLSFFAFILSMRIEAMALSFFLSTLAIIGYIVYSSYKKYSFFLPSLKLFSFRDSKILLTYGSVGLITNFTMLLLNNSDRYFIALFHSMSDVGIYNQNYAIAQTSIYALTMAFMNTINPALNKKFTTDLKNSVPLMNRMMFYYLLIMAPVTFVITYFAYEFNTLLLGKEFRSGYLILSYVSVSLFIYGFTSFSETRLKFSNRFRVVIIAFIIACLTNIILNFFLLRHFNYIWAAKTTLISFFILYIIISIYDYQGSTGFYRSYGKEITILIVITGLLLIVNHLLKIKYHLPENIVIKTVQIALNLIFLYSIGFVLFWRKRNKEPVI